MQLWQDGLVAMLAAIGLASLMWMVVRALFFAQPERRQGVVALIPAQGGWGRAGAAGTHPGAYAPGARRAGDDFTGRLRPDR